MGQFLHLARTASLKQLNENTITWYECLWNFVRITVMWDTNHRSQERTPRKKVGAPYRTVVAVGGWVSVSCCRYSISMKMGLLNFNGQWHNNYWMHSQKITFYHRRLCPLICTLTIVDVAENGLNVRTSLRYTFHPSIVWLLDYFDCVWKRINDWLDKRQKSKRIRGIKMNMKNHRWLQIDITAQRKKVFTV